MRTLSTSWITDCFPIEERPMKLKQPPPFSWQKTLWSNLCDQFESQQLAHAYLISGPRGTGKDLFANAFAKYLMCVSPNKSIACGGCKNCLLGREAGHPDIIKIIVEEGSRDIKVEQIRALSDFLVQTSQGGRAKITLITDAHHMNTAAANALLKTLEEPTPSTYIFLLSHLPGSLPATIRSRCQKLIMPTPSNKDAVDWLKQHIPDQEDPQFLAIAAGNCPLLALELARSGGLDHQQQFLQKLTQLTSGKTSIQATVGLATKLGETEVIGYLREVSTTLIKYLLINQKPSEIESHQAILLELFRGKEVAYQQILLSLMRFYEQVIESQRQLMSGANPNPQLIVESLLWRWSQLRTFQ